MSQQLAEITAALGPPKASGRGRRGLTDDQVRLIRTLHRMGYNPNQIATQMEVVRVSIDAIIQGKTYKDVQGDYFCQVCDALPGTSCEREECPQAE